MVYIIEDSYCHYNYVPGNEGEWPDDEGCGKYKQCNENTFHHLLD